MRSKELSLNGRELIVYEDGRVYQKEHTVIDKNGKVFKRKEKF